MELPYICNSGIADRWGSSLFGNFQQCLQLTNLSIEFGNLSVFVGKQSVGRNLLFVHHAHNHRGKSLASCCDEIKAILVYLDLLVCSLLCYLVFVCEHIALTTHKPIIVEYVAIRLIKALDKLIC